MRIEKGTYRFVHCPIKLGDSTEVPAGWIVATDVDWEARYLHLVIASVLEEG